MITNGLLFQHGCKWVKISGDEYKSSAGVILDVEHDMPIVGIILDIYVINAKEVALNVEKFSTTFEPHYRAYILDDNSSSSNIVLHSDLFIQTPIHIRKSSNPELNHNSFLLLPFALCTE